jgi:apolipoprotein D and lipocalin family protein
MNNLRGGLVALALALAGGRAGAEPPRTVEHVDLSRYMGRWYEIAALPNFFQRKCVRNTTADYALREDGLVSVTNRCVVANGDTDQADGVARVSDSATNAKLEVSFVSVLGVQLFWGDYWILDLGADYDYVLVGTPSRRWGWILARDPHPTRDRIDFWLSRLQAQGYDPREFVLRTNDQRGTD